jgi:tRNA threonylcarbamoyladenosine biosynthesis protein TsaB
LRILALDTATEVCSVAVLTQGGLLSRELAPGPGHSAHILGLVGEVLGEAGLALGDLDCIAFGRGPGAFTGVRLAASVTQGLAYAAGLKVVPVSNLLAVAQQALDVTPAAHGVLVCNDARMQEVYWSCAARGADGLAEGAGAEHVGPPEQVQLPATLPGPVVGAGQGFAVWPQLTLQPLLMDVHSTMLPRAREIARLALPEWLAGRAVVPEGALPVYLRDDVAAPSRK